MSHLPTLLPLGDSAWTVEFGDRIDPALHARVMGLNVALHVARDAGDLAGIVDLVPTFRSLTVHYDPLAVDGQLLGTRLLQMAEAAGSTASEGRHWLLPVCCDADLAPDLERLAEAKGMEPAQVIALLTATDAAPDGRGKMTGALKAFGYAAEAAGFAGRDVPHLELLDSDQLGLALGLENVIHAALTKGAAAQSALARAQRLIRYTAQTVQEPGIAPAGTQMK